MGVYYYLLNETKKECVDYDSHVKEGPMRFNSAVHAALANYMFEHPYDHLTIVSDASDVPFHEYKDIDLKHYEFEDSGVSEFIDSLIIDSDRPCA
jgi:hypothetical protein